MKKLLTIINHATGEKYKIPESITREDLNELFNQILEQVRSKN